MDCRDCKDCIAIEDCSACEYCIGCFGLYRKKYCLFNEELGKEEWEKRRKELGSLTTEKLHLLNQKLSALKEKLPHRASHIYGSTDCTGDGIFNSENCQYCFDINECEDCKFVGFTPKGIDTYDSTFTAPVGLELSYFNCSSLGGQRMISNFLAYHCSNTLYSMECHYCEHLFGCASMRHNDHCILNKQYSKEEYEKLAAKLASHMVETGEWGGYFPISCAPIAYNESNANDYFPLTKEQVESQGWPWRDEDAKQEKGEHLDSIPKTIEEVDDTICEKVLTCTETEKQYKINPQEFFFYKKMGIAIPHKHPHQRHRERFARRSPRKLWERTCAKCKKPISTSISPERSEIIYCEECYMQGMY